MWFVLTEGTTLPNGNAVLTRRVSEKRPLLRRMLVLYRELALCAAAGAFEFFGFRGFSS